MTARIAKAAAAAIAVLPLLALAGGISCKRTDKSAEEQPSPTKSAITIESDQVYAPVTPIKVTGLEISVPGKPTVKLTRKADGWHLKAPVVDRADQRAVEYALNELRKLDWVTKPVATAKSEWPAQGFALDQAATVLVTEGARTRPALILGKKKNALVGASLDLYRIHNLSYFTFARQLRFWRDRTITRFATDAITRLEVIDSRGRKLVLARVPPVPAPKDQASAAGAWSVEAGGKVDFEHAEVIYRRLLDLEGDDIAPITISEAGLEKPRLTIIAHTPDGATRIAFGADTQPAAKGRPGVYVRVNQSSRVLVLGNAAAKLLAAPLTAWR